MKVLFVSLVVTFSATCLAIDTSKNTRNYIETLYEEQLVTSSQCGACPVITGNAVVVWPEGIAKHSPEFDYSSCSLFSNPADGLFEEPIIVSELVLSTTLITTLNGSKLSHFC